MQHLDQVFPTRNSAQKDRNSRPSSSNGYSHNPDTPPRGDYNNHNSHSGHSSSGGRGQGNHSTDSVSSSSASHSANTAATASRYLAQLKSCEMRYVILKNELDETAAEEALLAKKRSKIKSGECIACCCFYVFLHVRRVSIVVWLVLLLSDFAPSCDVLQLATINKSAAALVPHVHYKTPLTVN